jgi:medium-chain acyl-[acyl-carrier-protein] hydrolase
VSPTATSPVTDAARVVATVLRFGQVSAPRRRLFCLPFAGGSAASYRTWHRTLPTDVDVVALQLPGRDARRRDRPLGHIADMVAAVRPVIEDATDLPYALFGHSMGALLAYELTVALEAGGGRPPAHLFVSARRPPDDVDGGRPIGDLPDAEFLDQLQLRYGGVPDIVRREPELLALLLPVLRADVRAIESYRPLTGRPVQCPLDVYGGLDDRHPEPGQLAGWQRLAECDVRFRLFPGDHFFLAAEQDALTADLAARWDDVAVASGPR